MYTAELKNVVDRLMVDEWTSTSEDYKHLPLSVGANMIRDIREFQRDAELEPDECIPENMTGEELIRVWNEVVDDYWVRKRSAIREYLLSEGNYEYPFNKYIEDYKMRYRKTIHPWIYTIDDNVYFCGENSDENPYSLKEFLKLVLNSPDFDPDKPYYWFDGEQLHSASNIFPEICDVDTIVDYCIKKHTNLDYAIEISM